MLFRIPAIRDYRLQPGCNAVLSYLASKWEACIVSISPGPLGKSARVNLMLIVIGDLSLIVWGSILTATGLPFLLKARHRQHEA